MTAAWGGQAPPGNDRRADRHPLADGPNDWAAGYEFEPPVAKSPFDVDDADIGDAARDFVDAVNRRFGTARPAGAAERGVPTMAEVMGR